MRNHRELALLIPALVIFGQATSRADEQAETLLRKVREATASARALQGEIRITSATTGRSPLVFSGSIRLKKPNLARIEFAPPAGITWASDGETLYWYSPRERKYRAYPVDPEGRSLWVVRADPVTLFFDPHFDLFGRGAPAPPRYLGEERLGGGTFRVIELRDPKEPDAFGAKLYIDDHLLITRVVRERKLDGGRMMRAECALSRVEVGVAIDEEAFAYRPPASARRLDQPESEDNLLDVGAKAPDFRLPSPTGGRIDLSETLKGKKAVLVNFWFLACGPCREEFPHLQRFHDEWGARGLAIIAINSGGGAKEVASYLSSHRFTFPVALGTDADGEGGGEASVFRAYGVGAWPTNYLVDSNGIIRWRGAGFDEAALRAALGEMGVR